MWYNSCGRDNDIVISSRVRLARNLVGYPFEEKLTEDRSREIIEKIKKLFAERDGWDFVELGALSAAERLKLAEAHVISPQFAVKESPCALLKNEEKNIYVMILEEDHLRLQCILAGSDLSSAADAVLEVESLLDSALEFAYDESLGYLTHCPTNLGTGMRASVMLHLPALTLSGGMRALSAELSKLGLTIRGINGEGSESKGCIYQISNRITLGISEGETVREVDAIVSRIVEKERTLRGSIDTASREELTDRVMRHIGILTYATKISSEELYSVYSDLRLGVSLGIVNIPYELLDGTMIECMPNAILADHANITSPLERDKIRAGRIREKLGLKR